MPVTDADIQALIILEVGDEATAAAPGGILAANIATIWASYADKAQIAPRLQELYGKRRCIDLVLGVVRGQVDFEIFQDHRRNQSQKAKALEAMRADCQAEIAVIEKKARTKRPGVAGLITTVTPLSPPSTSSPNANDPRYKGDPYTPTIDRNRGG